MLVVAGPVAYWLQVRTRQLWTPWYLPLLATVGVALMVASLRRRRGWVRTILLLPCVLICGMEWYLIGVASRTPAYTGPAQPGQSVPAFRARLADGKPFTEADLKQGTPSVLVFFRGRW
jgi:hypothetical protein